MNTKINFFDYNNAFGPVATTGNVDQVNNIPGGFTDQTRLGEVVECKTIQLREVFQNLSQATPSPLGDCIRTIIFVDLQANAGVPAVTDVLQRAVITSFYNWDNQQRFIILGDETTEVPVLSQDGALGISVNSVYHCMECKIPEGVRTVFQSSSTTIRSASLNIIHISQEPFTELAFDSRVIFVE